MDFDSSFQKTNLLIENLAEEIMSAALRETAFNCQDESEQISSFGYFGPTRFCCKEPYALLSSQVTFEEEKNFD